MITMKILVSWIVMQLVAVPCNFPPQDSQLNKFGVKPSYESIPAVACYEGFQRVETRYFDTWEEGWAFLLEGQGFCRECSDWKIEVTYAVDKNDVDETNKTFNWYWETDENMILKLPLTD